MKETITFIVEVRVRKRFFIFLKILRHTVFLWYPIRSYVLSWFTSNIEKFVKIRSGVV